MTENELKRHVLDEAYRQGWLVSHHVASTVRGSQGRGYPDLTLARDGIALWIELKQADGVLSPYQKQWQAALPRYEVIRPVDLARGYVRDLLA